MDTIDAFNSLVNNILPTLSEVGHSGHYWRKMSTMPVTMALRKPMTFQIGKIADTERLRAMAAENAVKSSDGANSEENQQMQVAGRFSCVCQRVF